MTLTPLAGRRAHLILMVFWVTQAALVWFIPSGWRVPYLVQVSIYANFVGHWSAWSAERPTEIYVPDDAS